MRLDPNSALRTPEQADRWVTLLAATTASALLAPAITRAIVRRVGANLPVAVGILAVVAIAIATLVALAVRRRPALLVWANWPWLVGIAMALGLIVMVTYALDVLITMAVLLGAIDPTTLAATLVGGAGAGLALLGAITGSYVVVVARDRVVRATLADCEVEAEFAGPWPRRDIAFLAGVGLLAILIVAGLGLWRFGRPAIYPVPGLVGLLVVGLVSLTGERTYRVTPAGLVSHRDGIPIGTTRLLDWSGIRGYTVTDRAIRLHRSGPHLDVRCAWADHSETSITAALDRHVGETGAGDAGPDTLHND